MLPVLKIIQYYSRNGPVTESALTVNNMKLVAKYYVYIFVVDTQNCLK